MTRRLMAILSTLMLLGAYSAGAQTPSANLYPGERVETLAGFPAMVRFYKGDPARPLLVFVPGSAHLGRIAYGFPGGHPEDFLAFWLVKEGYNFLAVSYPLRLQRPVYDNVTADFTSQDWANQIAAAARQAVDENHLSGSIVLMHWSLAGTVMERAAIASRKVGLKVQCGIALAATPPIPQAAPADGFTLDHGLIHRSEYNRWLAMLQADAAANGGRTVIPPEVFVQEFVGDMSANQQNLGETYRNGAFVPNPIDIAHILPTAGYPLVAVLQDDLAADPLHAMGDSSMWEFFNGRTVSRLGAAVARTLPAEKWAALIQLSRQMETRLDFPVGGNHFFFVGEAGAKAAAAAIDKAVAAADRFKADWSAISGEPFQ